MAELQCLNFANFKFKKIIIYGYLNDSWNLDPLKILPYNGI